MIDDEYILKNVLSKKGSILSAKINKLSEEEINYLKNRFIDSYKSSYKEIIYRIKNNIDLKPTCPICGNYLLFKDKKYLNTCGNKECIDKLLLKTNPFLNKHIQEKIHKKLNNKTIEEKQQIINKRKETCIKIYGCETPLLLDTVKEKIKEKYGVDNISKSQYFKDKFKETCLERYGVENPLQSIEIKEKVKGTCLKRYEEITPLLNEEIKENIKQTLLEKYGVDNISKSQYFKDKFKETCLERYGVENPLQSNEIKEKVKETCLERYGVEHSFQSEEVQEKIKKTCLEKYGNEWAIGSNIVRDKIINTIKEKYGGENGSFSGTQYYYTIIDDIMEKRYNTLKENNTFNSSTIENKLKQYFEEHNINYIYQYKSEKYPFVCDFYFPDKDLYCEIQGSWTHGSKPYEGTIEDEEKLNTWKEKAIISKYYKNAINVWTISDVEKRNKAKENNLNYLEIFSIDFNNCINKILKRLND